MGRKDNQQPAQTIEVNPLPKGAPRQHVSINGNGYRPPAPREGDGVAFMKILLLVAVLILGGFALIIACGASSSLLAGAV